MTPMRVSKKLTTSRDKRLSLDRYSPNVHFSLGLACMFTLRPERGIAAFEEAIGLNPSFAAAYVLLRQMYLYAVPREGDPSWRRRAFASA